LYINYFINPDDYQNPVKMFSDNHLYFDLSPKIEQLSTDIFFRKYFITDRQDSLFSSKQKKSLYIMNENSDYRA